MSLSYSENFIAISTYDENSYIGIITIDESKAVQGGKIKEIKEAKEIKEELGVVKQGKREQI